MNQDNLAEKFRADITNVIKEKDGELIAVASTSNYIKMFQVGEATQQHPDQYVPDARSIVVIGVKMVDSVWDRLTGEKNIYSSNLKSYLHHYNYNLLDYIAIQTARYIEDLGYDAYPIRARSDSEARTNGVKTGFFSFKGAAQAAGVGSIGKNSLILTPQYGPRVRFVALITDMPIQADNPSPDSNPCGSCTICLDACPVQALDFDEKNQQPIVQVAKCQAYMDFCQCAYCQAVCPEGKKAAHERRKLKTKE